MGAGIRTVSAWAAARIHVLSVFFGAWVLCKRALRWAWGLGAPAAGARHRDNPPPCLVDAELGQHKYVKLKGVKLHYVESGCRDQPLVLLLHGFPDFWLGWRQQIPTLSDYFRVVAVDLKGFGDSDKPLWRSSYKIDVVLEELRQFVHSLGVRSCTVVGHDLGALLGWYLVHQSPDIVDKFVAVSCPHPNVYWSAPSDGYQWLNYVQLPYLPELDVLKEDVKIIDQYHKHLPAKDAYLEAYKYTFSRKEDWTGPLNYYRNLPFLRISENCDQITVPIILITGDKDPFVKLEGIVRSTEFCERFHMKIIDGAGHFPHQENPAVFNKVVLKYLYNGSDKQATLERSPSKRFMEGLFGAVTHTMKYGNSVIDSVQKKTNGVVNSIPYGLSLNLGSNAKTEEIGF